MAKSAQVLSRYISEGKKTVPGAGTFRKPNHVEPHWFSPTAADKNVRVPFDDFVVFTLLSLRGALPFLAQISL
jgi:hypothetical protein